MSAATSPGTGLAYGLRRVCAAWGMARSSFYAMTSGQHAEQPALQPISMGLAGLYGSTAAGAARGLALRMDHGSQYLSDHFTNQIKFWGIQPSYAFVAEPQTNGVAERFNRTLKEQIIHGRIYRNIAELRDAVRDFVELYNAQWIVEKNGYLSPAQARQAWHAAISIRPAA